MIKIAIIGAGQLGSRHLQAIGKFDGEAEVFIIDPSEQSLMNAKKRFEEIHKEENIILQSFTKVQQLPKTIDIGIIATNSNIRSKVIKKFVNHTIVSNLIIEKFLFPKRHEYFEIQNLFRERNINAWVNCPRRMIDFYVDLKKQLLNKEIYEFNVFGSNWGIGTSSIHMIDLLSYLKNTNNYKILYEDFRNKPLKSKRNGFYEFAGRIIGEMEGTKFNLSSYQAGETPLTIEIITQDATYILRDDEGKGIRLSNTESTKLKEFSYIFPFQSQLTHLAIQTILDKKECKLTSFDDSVKLHLPLLDCFVRYFKRIGFDFDNCPIT